jgi:hypothetical protein
MKRMSQRNVVVSVGVAIALILSIHQSSPNAVAKPKDDRGLVDGIVAYEDQKPVKGATVYAVPLGRPMGAIIPHAETDETGYYAIHISRSWFGKFAVAAKKEDENFPDMSNQFYSDGNFQTATLTASHPAQTVMIRLGPKAGVLTGTVRDAISGATLYPCLELRRPSGNFLSGSGLIKANFRVLIPPATEVTVKMWLDGYRPWYYPGTDEQSRSAPLRLRPDEQKTLEILLQPSAPDSKLGCGMPVGTVVNPRPKAG